MADKVVLWVEAAEQAEPLIVLAVVPELELAPVAELLLSLVHGRLA